MELRGMNDIHEDAGSALQREGESVSKLPQGLLAAFQRLEQLLAAPPPHLEECSVLLAIRIAALVNQLQLAVFSDAYEQTFESFLKDFPHYQKQIALLRQEREAASRALHQEILQVLSAKEIPVLLASCSQIREVVRQAKFWEGEKLRFLQEPYYQYLESLPAESPELEEQTDPSPRTAEPTKVLPLQTLVSGQLSSAKGGVRIGVEITASEQAAGM